MQPRPKLSLTIIELATATVFHIDHGQLPLSFDPSPAGLQCA